MVDLKFQGAQVLRPDGVSEDDLSICDGFVAEDIRGPAVDLAGYLVLPGIVDIHGDGFERHLAPRRGAMKQMAEGLVAAEAELAANGITTAVLAQFVSWEGGLRGLEFADQVFAAIRDTATTVVTDNSGSKPIFSISTKICLGGCRFGAWIMLSSTITCRTSVFPKVVNRPAWWGRRSRPGAIRTIILR